VKKKEHHTRGNQIVPFADPTIDVPAQLGKTSPEVVSGGTQDTSAGFSTDTGGAQETSTRSLPDTGSAQQTSTRSSTDTGGTQETRAHSSTNRRATHVSPAIASAGAGKQRKNRGKAKHVIGESERVGFCERITLSLNTCACNEHTHT